MKYELFACMGLLLSSAAAGCSEATEQNGTVSTSTGASASQGAGAGAGGNGGGAGPATGASTGAGVGGSAPVSEVVVNEISAKGQDWIELFNAGTGPVDLSGFGLADSNDDGTPKVDEAVIFADGEIVPAGGFLVVVGDVAAAGTGPQTSCMPLTVPKCYQAVWKVSASNGEKVFLVNEKDQVAGEAEYPANAAGDGQTWGRFPDGTGEFAINLPTPAKANQTP